MKKWQLFIRHAHRSLHDRDLDNGLSDKGHRQGERLVNYLDTRKPRLKPARVYTSPKARCVETAEYVARWAGVELIIDARLDEQDVGREPDAIFRSRIETLCRDLVLESDLCLVSHGDVLPLILGILGYDPTQVKKGNLFFCIDEQVLDLNVVPD